MELLNKAKNVAKSAAKKAIKNPVKNAAAVDAVALGINSTSLSEIDKKVNDDYWKGFDEEDEDKKELIGEEIDKKIYELEADKKNNEDLERIFRNKNPELIKRFVNNIKRDITEIKKLKQLPNYKNFLEKKAIQERKKIIKDLEKEASDVVKDLEKDLKKEVDSIANDIKMIKDDPLKFVDLNNSYDTFSVSGGIKSNPVSEGSGGGGAISGKGIEFVGEAHADQILSEIEPKLKHAFSVQFSGALSGLEWLVKTVGRPKMDIEYVEQMRNNVMRYYPIKGKLNSISITFWDDKKHVTAKTLRNLYYGIFPQGAASGGASNILRDAAVIPVIVITHYGVEGPITYILENVFVESIDFDEMDDFDDAGSPTLNAQFKYEFFSLA